MLSKIEYLKTCCSFEHYVSLGHCCYVAIELENMGLRSTSSPFDWVRTRWKAIEYSINNNFKNYLNYDDLYQKKNALHVYKNLEYGVGFFHDFVDNKSLKSQISAIQKKYNRRIDRFFSQIIEPTLFIRYMWDHDELVYVASNYDKIERMIKSYNENNEIVFISHNNPDNVDISAIKLIFFINKDNDSELNEKPISSCEELFSFLSNVEYKKRETNITFNENKKINKKIKSQTLCEKLKRKFKKFRNSFSKKYTHNKQC